MDKARRDELRYLLSMALLMLGEAEEALEHLKPCSVRWPHSVVVYNAWSRWVGRVVQ